MIREKLVWAEQPNAASIYLQSLTDEPAEQAVQKAIIATVAETNNEQHPQTQQRKQPYILISELPPKSKPAVLLEKYEKEKIEAAEDQEQQTKN